MMLEEFIMAAATEDDMHPQELAARQKAIAMGNLLISTSWDEGMFALYLLMLFLLRQESLNIEGTECAHSYIIDLHDEVHESLRRAAERMSLAMMDPARGTPLH